MEQGWKVDRRWKGVESAWRQRPNRPKRKVTATERPTGAGADRFISNRTKKDDRASARILCMRTVHRAWIGRILLVPSRMM